MRKHRDRRCFLLFNATAFGRRSDAEQDQDAWPAPPQTSSADFSGQSLAKLIAQN